MCGKCALYLRLSRDDGGMRESESIANQRDFLTGYAAEHGFFVVRIISDDGYSGISFDRPGFCEMLELIRAGEIDTVITKDLSRLGRDYIQTGYYIEQFFPLHGVRYIAVNDGIDSKFGVSDDDMTPFRAVFNDMYAKDISKKVRCALDTKKRLGKFIGSNAPYGYKKDAADRGRLVPDAAAVRVVREIYALFVGGASPRAIAAELTERGIVPPAAYSGAREGGVWSADTVRRILSSPTYAGNLTQNTSRKLSYKLDKRVRLSQEERITVRGSHEAIVTEEIFARAQELLAAKSYKKLHRGGREHILSGLIFCAGCGAPMSFSGGKCSYIVCSRRRRDGCELCDMPYMREELALGAVCEGLGAYFGTAPVSRADLQRLCGKIYIGADFIRILLKQLYKRGDI